MADLNDDFLSEREMSVPGGAPIVERPKPSAVSVQSRPGAGGNMPQDLSNPTSIFGGLGFPRPQKTR